MFTIKVYCYICGHVMDWLGILNRLDILGFSLVWTDTVASNSYKITHRDVLAKCFPAYHESPNTGVGAWDVPLSSCITR